MWPSKRVEIKISDDFDSSYHQRLESFLQTEFAAQFTKKQVVEPELSLFEYSIERKTITVMFEGMSGTSLLGPRDIIKKIISAAKKHGDELVNSSL